MPMLTPIEEKLRAMFVDLHADTMAKLATLEKHLKECPGINRRAVLRTRRNLRKVREATQAHIEWYDTKNDGIKPC